MLKILLFDDSGCKSEFSEFIKKHHLAVKALISSRDLLSHTNLLLASFDKVNNQSRKLLVNTNESLTLLDIFNVMRCEGDRNYTNIFMADKKKYIVSKTLLEFEEMLSKYNFIRIHKSHLVNINFLEKFIKTDGGYIILSDGTKLPVSSRRRENLFRILSKL
jgi:two-component system, LytTR family, response regulator